MAHNCLLNLLNNMAVLCEVPYNMLFSELNRNKLASLWLLWLLQVNAQESDHFSTC